MQEEVTRKTVALCVETGKMTAHVLQKAMKKVLEDMAKAKNQPRLHHGKQTLRQLMKHNTGVSNIEITDQNIRAFSSTAKKYGLDFALKKDTTGEHTRYLVFFKGRDADLKAGQCHNCQHQGRGRKILGRFLGECDSFAGGKKSADKQQIPLFG